MSHISRRTTAMVEKSHLIAALTAKGGVVSENADLRYYAGQKARAEVVVGHSSFQRGYDLGFNKNPATRTYEAVGDLSMMGRSAQDFLDELTQEYGVQESLAAAANAGYEVESIETLATGERKVRLTVTVA